MAMRFLQYFFSRNLYTLELEHSHFQGEIPSKMVVSELERSIKELKFDDNDELDIQIARLYADPGSLSIEEVSQLLNAAVTKKSPLLKKKINEDVDTTITIMSRLQSATLLNNQLQDGSIDKYVKILKTNVKLSKEGQSAIFKVINSFITSLKPKLSEVEPLISIIIPYIDQSDSVFLTLVMSTVMYKEEAYPFFEEQLEILTLQQNLLASLKFLSLLFSTAPPLASKLFKLDSLQSLLAKLSAESSVKNIKAALNLLSDACIHSDLRDFIAKKYLSILSTAFKYSETDVQTLAGLVALKTWNLNALATENVKVDHLVDIFVSNMDDHSIEGLTYITLRKAVRIRLREDHEFIFNLFDLLDKSTKITTIFGIITIFANLSAVEEKNEYSELKKQAQKNLEEEVEEDANQIREFQEELVERKLVSKIAKHISKSTNITDQATKVLYNLTKSRTSHTEILKQGGLHLLIKAVGIEKLQSRPQGLRALSLLLATSDPRLVFGSDSPKTAFNYLFHSLIEETSTPTDQNLALIALTNLSVIDIGGLSAKQWEIIDQYLMTENTILRRSTIELVSNLMQHKDNMVELFNFQKTSAKKRYELIVEFTQLEDVKSQSAALSAISFGVGVPFIAEEVAESKNTLEYLVRILDEQISEASLVERAIFILYYIVFYLDQSDPDGPIIQKLRSNEKLENSIPKIISTIKDKETVEMAFELASIIKFN